MAPPVDDLVLELERLSLWYGSAQALKSISMKIARHRITAFIGSSGCGKSTLLRSINRLNDLIPEVRTGCDIRFEGEHPRLQLRHQSAPQADRDGVPEVEPVSQVDL